IGDRGADRDERRRFRIALPVLAIRARVRHACGCERPLIADVGERWVLGRHGLFEEVPIVDAHRIVPHVSLIRARSHDARDTARRTPGSPLQALTSLLVTVSAVPGSRTLTVVLPIRISQEL